MTASIGAGSRSRRGRHGMRKYVACVAFALLAVGTVGPPVLADDASLKDPVMSRGWKFDEQGGEDLFGHVCAGCHQPDAKGAIGAAAYPPLAADQKLASTDFLLGVLLDGLRGMPPLGSMMSDEQVADVVNYVRTHFGNSYADALSAADVAAARRRPKSELR
jgi:mono/diheme cytochrome c family protein